MEILEIKVNLQGAYTLSFIDSNKSDVHCNIPP